MVRYTPKATGAKKGKGVIMERNRDGGWVKAEEAQWTHERKIIEVGLRQEAALIARVNATKYPTYLKNEIIALIAEEFK